MAKVNGTFYTAERLRRGTTPVSPPYDGSEGQQPPVTPSVKQQYPEMKVREDNELIFNNDYSIGIESSARTGNITADFVGCYRGAVTVMRHNDSIEPSYPTENIIISGEYISSEDNYLCFILVNKIPSNEVVLCTISQEMP